VHEEYVVGHIQEALAKDPRIGELEISVRVTGREVHLLGTVPTAERRTAITEVVRELLPDYDVRNETTVGPFPESRDTERLR
jgi:osmotically-inducible protein OsmY